MTSMRRRALIAAVLSSAAIFAIPSVVAAQPLSPYRGETTCIALLLLDAVPGRIEWSYWLAGGGGWALNDGRSSQRVLGAGVEVTTPLTAIGTERRYGGAFQLRGGLWWGLTSDLVGTRAETGYTFLLDQASHAQWGTYTLRIGGGLGDDSLGTNGHFVATLTGGIRSAPGRYSERGACDSKPGPKPSIHADNVRLFATARRTFADTATWQLTFGVEFSPTFFLPPYSLGKWIGARP